jgi:hypothetical protein
MIGVRDEIDSSLEPLLPFRSALHFGTNSEGLHLSVFLLFRLGRPSLFIPWSEISASPAEGIFSKKMKLDFRGAPRVSLYISDRLGRELIKRAPWYSQSAT